MVYCQLGSKSLSLSPYTYIVAYAHSSHDALYVGNRAAPSSVDELFDFMLSVGAGRHQPLHVEDSVMPLLAGPRDGRGWALITLPLMRQLSLIGASSVRTGVLS